MQSKAYHFSPKLLLALVLAIFMSSPVRSESFSCAKIFRSSYSMFLFRSPSFLINISEMVFTYKKVPIHGSMYFNMCGLSSVSDLCGDERVSGRFIFVNKSGIPGTPKCLVMNEKEDNWEFTRFSADSQSVNLEGVKIQNPKMEVEAIGGLADDVEDFIKDKQSELLNGLNQMGLAQVTNNEVFKGIQSKIQIDSDKQNTTYLRLLTKTNQQENKQKEQEINTPIEIIVIDDPKEQINTQLKQEMQNIIQTNKQNGSSLLSPPSDRTPQFLAPAQRNSSFKPGDDVIEEGNHIKTLIQKKLQKQLLATIQNNQSQTNKNDPENKHMRVLTSKELEIKDVIPGHVAKVFDMEIKTEYNFYCDSGEPKLMLHHLPRENLLEINVYSSDGCVVNFEFLQVLNEIPWLTGSIFLILGIGLALFGIKVYRNLLIVFIPMMIAILGFYLYFAIVENKSTSTTKILTLVGLLVFIFIIAVLMVWFNWLIYLIIAFGVSCQFGLLAHSFLADNVGFFTKPYTEWILIALFFILFTVMYIVAKDYFVILSTAIMGALFIILSLKYMGITDFDLLFDVQIDKFADFDCMEREVKTMCFVFIGVVIFGAIVQIILLKRQQKKEEEEEKSAKMQDIHHDHNKNINIQLENI